MESVTEKRKVVCLCGSTKFNEAYERANFDETLAGNIVLTIGVDMKSAFTELHFAGKSEAELGEIKSSLDTLHFAKIDLADEILVLNVGGYIGESTRKEIKYAHEHDKSVRYLAEPEKIYVYKVVDGNPDVGFYVLRSNKELLDWMEDQLDTTTLNGMGHGFTFEIDIEPFTQGELDAMPTYE